MHPAFSVLLLTTLIGVGQGLFLALYTVQYYAFLGLLGLPRTDYFVIGSAISVAFLVAGLIASFFHLGHPERAWRAAARWRTSWLSREVIVLPLAAGGVAAYGAAHHLGLGLHSFGLPTAVPDDLTLLLGAATTVTVFALFLCTGMIYACIRFLQEWATPLTVINYTLFGGTSGFLLATLLAAQIAPELVMFLGRWTAILLAVALITRGASLVRNRRLRYKSSQQTAIGVRHARITQTAQGFMGGSFNTREFFHGARPLVFRSLQWVFLALVFPVTLALLWPGITHSSPGWLAAAFVVHYLGLLVERWFFFAQANHPQNLYYQVIS
jgi:DMSO reductase anchor subunit